MLKKNDNRNEAGMTVRRKVLGNAHVERAEKTRTAFDAPFQELIVEAAWGRVWARPDWTLAQRSCITLALLAAGGHWEEFEMHLRATRNTGATPEDVRETLLHVAIYSGVPAANHAFQIAKKVLASMEKAEPAKEQRK